MNEDCYLKPEKPFVLIGKLKDGNDFITWHDTIEDLIWCAKNNTAVVPYEAFEIGSIKEIDDKFWSRK